MTAATPTYRWNTSAAAEGYDEAAPAIHPYYETIQKHILERMPIKADEAFLLVDLGGGSGRLVERVLQRFRRACAVIVDQSAPFLALAERRLGRFAPRASFVQRRLQDDWEADLRAAPDVIVSTSAIHHLVRTEKRSLFVKCFGELKPGGLLINGDEYRPADDAEYRELLQKWSAHMFAAVDAGRIPASFRQTLDFWQDRNIRRFGEPKQSGDDCHETIATQVGYLHDAGFDQVAVVWNQELWAIVVGRKVTRTS
ncbi:MAG TPA: class I SAM-dependent methyltransferase [Lacipirellulaceae bacterium]|nr:class I SAM-dependent methyltransferase [Lacipirellulaceae bacterium]